MSLLLTPEKSVLVVIGEVRSRVPVCVRPSSADSSSATAGRFPIPATGAGQSFPVPAALPAESLSLPAASLLADPFAIAVAVSGLVDAALAAHERSGAAAQFRILPSHVQAKQRSRSAASKTRRRRTSRRTRAGEPGARPASGATAAPGHRAAWPGLRWPETGGRVRIPGSRVAESGPSRASSQLHQGGRSDQVHQ